MMLIALFFMLISFYQEVSRDMKIMSFDGTSYYLVEVIAFVLGHLKYLLEYNLSRDGLSADDFNWVITVPTIWNASGKQMMREAASLVSLLYVLARAEQYWYYHITIDNKLIITITIISR